jgi:hypothetical protein
VLNKIGQIFRTIIYLKWYQIFYQFYYRFKRYIVRPDDYDLNDKWEFELIKSFTFYDLYESQWDFEYPLTFSFLNQKHKFHNYIDWNFIGLGKLWNYNLQYCDFLNNHKIDENTKLILLKDCAESIILNKLKLEPYPVSIRIVNTFFFISKSNIISTEIDKSLKIQIRYLEKNLEYHIEANHLLENYIALTFSGIFYSDSHLLKKYYPKTLKALESQILNDGGHYECSPMYHVIILSKLTVLKECLTLKLISTDTLDEVLKKMMGWISTFSFRNNNYSFFNDATSGIAPDLKLLYKAAKHINLNFGQNNLFDSGYRKFVDDRFEILVDVGNIIPSFQPGHAHSDMLSFCMNYDNKSIIVDNGISTYQIGELRDFERSTKAHNTVTLFDKNQSEVWGGFRVGKRATITIIKDNPQQLSANHNGYFAEFGINHLREFEFNSDGLVILDKLEGKNLPVNAAVCRFYFDFNIELKLVDSNVFVDDLLIFNFEKSINISILKYRQAIGYNLFKESQYLEITFQNELKTSIFKK